jgi:hypothetical protein
MAQTDITEFSRPTRRSAESAGTFEYAPTRGDSCRREPDVHPIGHHCWGPISYLSSPIVSCFVFRISAGTCPLSGGTCAGSSPQGVSQPS